MVVCAYLLDTAPVVMDFQEYDVKGVRTKDSRVFRCMCGLCCVDSAY